MGSCLGKIRGQNARGGGYERASRNAEDAFDSDSDTDAPLLDTEEEESRAERAASTSAPAVPKLQVGAVAPGCDLCTNNTMSCCYCC